MTMDGMTPAHAKPARRDHLWVLAVIAACCLIKVWPSWVGIGAEAAFPKIGHMPTDWTLAVVVEAYWAYAVYAWLAAAGPRSRRFAMWSAAVVFVLSVVGQSAAPVMAATAVKVFANALPVVVLALIAVLVHLRIADRAAAADAARESAAAQETAALRAGLSAEREALQPLRDALAAAEAARDETLKRAEAAERKLAAKTARAKRSKAAHDDDLTTEMRALTLFEKNPDLRKPGMGAELGRQLGKSAQTGRRLHSKLTAQDPPGERSAQAADERYGERP